MTREAPELLEFFKAMADETRLKMAGLLAARDYSGEQLAELLAIRPATVSHHLSKLSGAGLVVSRAEGHSKLYRLRLDAVHAVAEQLLSPPPQDREAAASTPDAKIIADFSNPDGSLKQIPAQRKKLMAVLRHLVRNFVPGRRYTEKQVNAVLSRFHPDAASLRREMIACKLMAREAGKYWRTPAP
jgi:DNA-binding transcriptional ArsR family regulator